MQTFKVFTTPPLMESRGKAEAIGKAHVPTEPRSYRRGSKSYTKRVPSARSYVFAEDKPADAKYLRTLPIPGKPATSEEIRRLYVRSSKTQRKHKFKPGDQVSVKRGRDADVAATVTEVIRAGWYKVRVAMFGKSHEIKIRESDLVVLHPGS